MRVTLMTDASHCPKWGAGGYGFWCASDRGKLPGGGALQGVIKDSYEAEMKAVANAMHTSIKAGLIADSDTLLIQLDNLGVVNCINGLNKPRADVAKVLQYIFQLGKQFNLTIKAKHVKGHTNRTENRYVANGHCDERAYKGMKQARSILNEMQHGKHQNKGC